MDKIHTFYASLASLLLVSCASKQFQLTGIERTRVIVDSRYDQNPDEAAVKFLEPYKHVNDSIMGPIVGTVAHNMHAARPESDLSNLLADILVWSGKDYGESPVLGIYNMGGIRADLTKGKVTYGDVLDVAPFENKICFITLTGEQILQLYAQIAIRGGEGVSHGVEIVASKDGKLLSGKLHGKEIDPAGSYRVTTVNYLLEGNDKMMAFRKGTDIVSPQDASNNSRFLIMKYFKEKENKGEAVDARIEGRIKVKSEEL
jgi:2',3'-cyclic-nucleotide 2'-phosphodiesterase (5'-nucleotidase family)